MTEVASRRSLPFNDALPLQIQAFLVLFLQVLNMQEMMSGDISCVIFVAFVTLTDRRSLVRFRPENAIFEFLSV